MSKILKKAGFKGTNSEWLFVQNVMGEPLIATKKESFHSGHQTICKVFLLGSSEENRANTFLIKSAPELLEHLIKLTTILEFAYADKKMVLDARKAINKALNLQEDGQ